MSTPSPVPSLTMKQFSDNIYLFENETGIHLELNKDHKTVSIFSNQYPKIHDGNGKDITQSVFDNTLLKAVINLGLTNTVLRYDEANSNPKAPPKMVKTIKQALRNTTKMCCFDENTPLFSPCTDVENYTPQNVDSSLITQETFTSDHILSL